jgi:hypothetical protein
MRIMDLCDSDKRLIGQGLGHNNQVMINELKWRDLKRLAAAISVAYNPALSQFVKAAAEFEKRLIIGQAPENKPIIGLFDSFRQSCNNYRKFHALTDASPEMPMEAEREPEEAGGPEPRCRDN